MEKFSCDQLEECFPLFERAATKGHEESIWITSVLDNVQLEKNAVKEAFAMAGEPLGWYMVGELSYGRERFDFYKKSVEGGCSWGQVAYGWYFHLGTFVEKDEKVHVEWLEKAAKQNNPWVMKQLGDWFRDEGGDKQKAVSYYRTALDLGSGSKESMYFLADMLRKGVGCKKDLRQAVVWSAKGDSMLFWELLEEARGVFESGATENSDCNFDQLCFSLGWGLFWYAYEFHNFYFKQHKKFCVRSMDFYCSCIELQQKSLFTFLLCWNRATGGVKDVGATIGQMVWDGRGDNLVKKFEVRSE
jgi:hypothetical protein